eukprot:TRINITY_DN905_c1_g1_i1.p1 TRINITY_DN905_c1_g1~~TRINITY_DN905_c1_g1_i1.p1  ORF type:complete len:567 (+),score=171.21 TRINITY_DN905_c1_g1_i1:565-2265(+)
MDRNASYESHDAYKYNMNQKHQHPYAYQPTSAVQQQQQQQHSIQHELTPVSQDAGAVEHQRSVVSLMKLQAMDECEERWLGRAASWQEEAQMVNERNTALKAEVAKGQEKIHRLEDKMFKVVSEAQHVRESFDHAQRKVESLEGLLGVEKEKSQKLSSQLDIERSSFEAKIAAAEMQSCSFEKELEHCRSKLTEMQTSTREAIAAATAAAAVPSSPPSELLEALSRAERAEALAARMTEDLRDKQNTSDIQNNSLLEAERCRWEEKQELLLQNQTLSLKVESLQSSIASMTEQATRERDARANENDTHAKEKDILARELEARTRERDALGRETATYSNEKEAHQQVVKELKGQMFALKEKSFSTQGDVQQKVFNLSNEIKKLQRELGEEAMRAEKASILTMEVAALKEENQRLRDRAHDAQRLAVSPLPPQAPVAPVPVVPVAVPPPPTALATPSLQLPMHNYSHDIAGLSERNKMLNGDLENLQSRHAKLQCEHGKLQEKSSKLLQERSEWKYKALLGKPTTVRCVSCGAKNTAWPNSTEGLAEAGHRRHRCKHRQQQYMSDCSD